MQGMSFLAIMEIVGPIVLLVLLIWVVLHNRSSRASKAHTERATKANYEAEDKAHKDDEV